MAETDRPLTTDELRAKFGTDIHVTLPGGGTWHCRRPDLRTMVVENVIALPTLHQVIDDLAPGDDGKEKTFTDLANLAAPETKAFLRRWATLAAKSPRIVLTREEEGPDAICVEDVPVSVRLAIFNETCDLEPPAAGSAPATSTFPATVPDGATAAPGGADVPDEAVDVSGDQRST